MTPTEVALAAMAALFTNYDADAAKELLAQDYIQHNLNVPTGAAPVLGLVGALEESGISVDIHRVITDGDLVALHSTYTNAQMFGAPELVAFDVFRIEDGKIAEHWDNLQPVAPANSSVRTATDGPTEVTDRAKTAENKAIVEAFIADVLMGAAPQKITEYVSTETYLQHNPAVGDGLAALGEAMAAMAENGMTMVYKETPLIVAEGNFVLTGSEGMMGEAPTAFYDLFRLEDGKIVEHWDVIAPIPAESAHENGKF